LHINYLPYISIRLQQAPSGAGPGVGVNTCMPLIYHTPPLLIQYRIKTLRQPDETRQTPNSFV